MNLKQRAFSAGRWTAASAAVRAGLQLLQIAILARLLQPAEFGLMAVAIALLAVIALFADLGLSRALIHHRDVSHDALSSLYWLNVTVALFLMLLLAAIAPALAILYASPELSPLLQIASLLFPLTAFGQQFRVLAEKELRFADLAYNEVCSGVFGFVTAVGIAIAGGGVHALIGGQLLAAATSSALAWKYLSDGFNPAPRLRMHEILPYLRSGSYLVGDSFVHTLRMQADIFVGGMLLTPAAMGVYTVPRALTLRVASIFDPIVTRVGFPAMAKVQHDRSALRSIYLQTLRMTTSANFPVYVALFLFADEVIALFLGPRWYVASASLRILAVWGLIRSVGSPVGSLIYAVGRAQLAFWWTVVLLIFFPPLFWLGAQLAGLEGLAWSLLVTQLCLYLPTWRYMVYPNCGASLTEYSRQITVPLVLSLCAGTLAFVSVYVVHGTFLRLVVGCGIGALVYFLLSVRFNRPWITALLELLKLRT